MLVDACGDDEAQELVEVKVALRVGDALGFDDEQALEGVYYFLNMLPLVCAFPYFDEVPLDDFIDAFVLLDEDEQ